MTMARVDLAGKLSDSRARVAAETPPAGPPAPMFAQLARKDARIRDDQVTALTALADAVMRRRRFKAERITENTLIRVAIDLLLAHADQLRGSTEAELRNSVTSGLPTSGRPHSATPAPTPTLLGTSDVRDSSSPGPDAHTGQEASA